jgi:hypothetical protein
MARILVDWVIRGFRWREIQTLHLASNPGGISPLLTSVFPATHGAITIEHVRAILACDVPVTPDIAQRIGRWAGNWLALWLSLQARWDSG